MEEYNYDDIIGLPHHVSKRHPQMSRLNRAAQFAPFAALTGYGSAVNEEARLTGEREELTEEQIDLLNRKMSFLRAHIAEQPELTVTYFLADERKEGGRYVRFAGKLSFFDDALGAVVFADKKRIAVADIIDIESGILPAETI